MNLRSLLFMILALVLLIFAALAFVWRGDALREAGDLRAEAEKLRTAITWEKPAPESEVKAMQSQSDQLTGEVRALNATMRRSGTEATTGAIERAIAKISTPDFVRTGEIQTDSTDPDLQLLPVQARFPATLNQAKILLQTLWGPGFEGPSLILNRFRIRQGASVQDPEIIDLELSAVL